MTSPHDSNESPYPSGEPGAGADGQPTAKERTAAIKDHTIAAAKQATAQARAKAGHATELAKNKTPEPLLHTVNQTASHVRDTARRAGHLAADKTPDAVRAKAAQTAHAQGPSGFRCSRRQPPSSSSS
ncbi:hypothetical protein ABZ567_20160 [Streptomyces sp. NPDC016459]|uniref:hypothetical protein n=1 Tax=Streptomyces sp. NPDC016459 TaxID=3157190 RepID=UPI0033C39504